MKHNVQQISELIDEILSTNGIILQAFELSQIGKYLELLLQWNSRIRLVGSRDVETIISDHIVDSIQIATVIRSVLLNNENFSKIVDIGSGAGLPGFLISLLNPNSTVYLCEINEKKASFLHELKRKLMANFQILHQDATKMKPYSFDLAVSRATWPPEKWLEIGRNLVSKNGYIFFILSEKQKESLSSHFEKIDLYVYFLPGGQKHYIGVFENS